MQISHFPAEVTISTASFNFISNSLFWQLFVFAEKGKIIGMLSSAFGPVRFLPEITIVSQFLEYKWVGIAQRYNITIKKLSVYIVVYFPVVPPSKCQQGQIKNHVLWIPSMFLPASLQTLLKDMIKLSWPAPASFFSKSRIENKIWSHFSTFTESKCNLNMDRRQSTTKPYLVLERNWLCTWFFSPLPITRESLSSVRSRAF